MLLLKLTMTSIFPRKDVLFKCGVGRESEVPSSLKNSHTLLNVVPTLGNNYSRRKSFAKI